MEGLFIPRYQGEITLQSFRPFGRIDYARELKKIKHLTFGE